MIQHLLQLCVSSLILLASAVAQQQKPCAPASCGNVTKISFPFYIPALQESNCGLPGFELNCTDLGIPIFRISPDNHEYVVESISDADPIIRLYDAALLTFNSNITCLPEITNTTLPRSRFSYFNTTSLHLFPLCRRNVTVGLWPYRVICDPQDDDQIWNLAINEDANPAHLRTAVQNCERHVVAPVNFEPDNIFRTLRRGFQLRWTTGDVNVEPSPPSTEANFSAPPPSTEANFSAPPPSTEANFSAPPPSTDANFSAPPPSFSDKGAGKDTFQGALIVAYNEGK